MHPDKVKKFESFAQRLVNSALQTSDYDALKIFLMQTESMLGEAESQFDKQHEDYEDNLRVTDAMWGQVCEVALEKAVSFANDSPEFARTLSQSLDHLEADLLDNYIHGAIAAVFSAHENEPALERPLLAAAAYNKHAYKGYGDEIACLRMLLWAGFDPNAQDEDGMTALHYMASLKHSSNSHPRAVRLLLEAGANPNLQNVRGDTPLCYLSGNTRWTGALNYSAWMLFSAGADPNLPAGDGATAKSLLIAANAQKPDESRAQLIAELG